jgi:hypothetical protein
VIVTTREDTGTISAECYSHLKNSDAEPVPLAIPEREREIGLSEADAKKRT